MLAPFRIRGTPPAGIARSADEQFRSYLEKLTKLVPIEVLSLYVIGVGLIPAYADAGLVIWILFCLFLLFIIRAYGTSDPEPDLPPQWGAVIIAAVSFLLWVYTLGGPFKVWNLHYPVHYPWAGALLLLGWTFLTPLCYQPITVPRARRPAPGLAGESPAERDMRARLPNGATVAYDDVGRGPAVVLLHAFPLSRGMWRPQVEALASDFRVITPDLRGFGGTDGFTKAPTIEQMADDTAELLDTLGITDPVVLGGVSMGGYVALAFARKHDRRLRGLILADTRAEPDDAEGKANRDRLIAFAEKHSAADVLANLLPKMVSEETRTQRPEVVEEVKQLAAVQTPAGLIGALKAMRDRPDATSVLGNIAVPTLVLVGSADVITTPRMVQRLAEGIPGARLVQITGAGHLSCLERAEEFNTAVREFLESIR